ncbi:tyrosine-type recombinase/integrase [Paracholeplasma manati]|uniref:tyrosine-type recombinase/integrase n=1 Tax=Paracholeplasma manati TaxID=591373 RepID=UPI0024082778|nr:tyrosine-type recombinase/integrase [Paracholeplasma manati]MDG0888942.1 tyrosine-type recombinase/integrase [Paracholeplasma manati]
MDTHPLEALSEQYLSGKKLAPTSLKYYRSAYKHFIQYLKERDILYPKTSDVVLYRERKREGGSSTYNIHVHICALKGLYKYLSLNQKRLSLPEVYQYDIMMPVKNEPIKPQMTKPVLTIEEARHLILSTKEQRRFIWHFRNHAIISLMLTSGLTVHQVVHAKRADFVEVDGAYVLYITRRTGQNKTQIKLSKGTILAIQDYLSKRKDDNPHLFCAHKHKRTHHPLERMFFYTMFKKVLKETGLEYTGITPCCLRHTAAIFNLERGGSIEQTKALLGHVSIQSTLVYQAYLDRLKDDSERQIESMILHEDNPLDKVFLTYILIA